MTVGAGDNDFSDYGQGCFQITPKLVAAGDVVEIYKRFLAEKNLLHVGKTGELCNTMMFLRFIPAHISLNPSISAMATTKMKVDSSSGRRRTSALWKD